MRRVAFLAGAALAFAACRGPASGPDSARGDAGIELAIEGNESFETDEIEKFLRKEMKGHERPSKADVDDAAFALELHYLTRPDPGCVRRCYAGVIGVGPDPDRCRRIIHG